MESKILLSGLCFIFLMAFAMSQPAFQETTDSENLRIFVHDHEYIRANSSYTFSAHVHNVTTGRGMSSEDFFGCLIQIIRPSDGEHIIDTSMSVSASNPVDMEYEVTGTNFSELGEYKGYITCTEGDVGGARQWTFYVTKNGNPPIGMGQSIIIFSSLFVIMMFSVLFYLFSIRLNSDTFKIIFLTISAIMFLITAMYSMVLVDNLVFEYSNVFNGFEAFFTVLIYGVLVLVIAFMIFALLVAIRLYKFKRGWID